jgi:hypothetical protein
MQLVNCTGGASNKKNAKTANTTVFSNFKHGNSQEDKQFQLFDNRNPPHLSRRWIEVNEQRNI